MAIRSFTATITASPSSPGPKLAAIEVKTGRDRSSGRGLAAFRHRYEHARTALVGPGGMSLADFFSQPAGYWVAPE